MATVMNHEFRDMAAESPFPFTAESSLRSSDGSLLLPSDCFLDALFYPVSGAVGPYHVASVDGSYGADTQMLMIVEDAMPSKICEVTLDSASDTAMARDDAGAVVGVVVYDPAKMVDLIAEAGRIPVEFDVDAAVFVAGVCFGAGSEGTMFVETPTDVFTGDVVIAAAGGVRFEFEWPPDPETSSSSSSFNESRSSESSESSSSSPSSSSDVSGTSSSEEITSSSSPSSSVSTSSSASSSSESTSSSEESTSESSSSSEMSSQSESSGSSSSSPSSSSSSSSNSESSSESSWSSSSLNSTSSEVIRSGVVSVNVYGELHTLDRPVTTVNKRAMEHVWLSAHPDSAVRIVTDSGGMVTVGKSKDFGKYAG